MTEIVKICKKHGEVKGDDIYIYPGGKVACKICKKKYYEDNRDKIKQKYSEYYFQNKERINLRKRAYDKERYKNNEEYRKKKGAYLKDYLKDYLQNEEYREKRNIAARKHYHKNKSNYSEKRKLSRQNLDNYAVRSALCRYGFKKLYQTDELINLYREILKFKRAIKEIKND